MSRDLRKFASQTNIRLIIGGLILVFVVGLGCIYVFSGQGAAIAGLLCLLAGLIPLFLIWAVFFVLELITKRAREQ